MELQTPAGRIVQGKIEMQQRKDSLTKQLQWKDAAKTVPDMGMFFSLAFPKTLPDGSTNAEFNAFYMQLVQVAATSWPQFFPNGAQPVIGGGCTNPKFSWKYQDGDGVDTNGQSVAGKAGFKGHHIIKFDTNFPVSVYHLNQYRPDQEIGIGPNAPKVTDVVKRGFWIVVALEVKSNMADLSKQQVPGISLYPKLITFLGGRAEDEIKSGPDAQATFGNLKVGYMPQGLSAIPGAPVGTAAPGGLALPGAPTPLAAPGLALGAPAAPGLALGAPAAPGLALPTPPALTIPTPPVAPVYVVAPAYAQQGHTLQSITAQMSAEAAAAAGYLVLQAAAPVAPAPLAPPVLTPPVKTYKLAPHLAAQGLTFEGVKAQGWTEEAGLAAGHYVLG
jgi:hypothetical protein